MSNLLGRRAVVIGAGIGGLATAGVLANHFEQVDVLERDLLGGEPASRPGTPQDRHPHGLLVGGLRALDEIFPGFERDLAAAGGVYVETGQDLRFERPDFGTLPRRDFNIWGLGASRPLIDNTLRRKARAVANITLWSECRVLEIVPMADRSGVKGVRFENLSGLVEEIDADLVVDASGRGALTLALFDAIGRQRPAITEVGIDISYATAIVEAPSVPPTDWKVVATLPNPPETLLHAVILPAEGNRWYALIADHGRPSQLQDWPGFLEELRRLHTSTMYDALHRLPPPENIRHYGFPASFWRHFEQLPDLPRGILPIADAVCRFNPIYGQGMSSAARQARLLQRVLGRVADEPDPLAAAQAGFMAEIGSVLQTPWIMSTSADLAFPGTRGERPEGFEEGRQYEAAAFRAAAVDPVVHRALLEVSQLLKPLDILHAPEMKQRIEAAAVKMSA